MISAPASQRTMRLWIVVLAVLCYLAIDGYALATRANVPQWGLRVDRSGVVTYVDPNSPASDNQIDVGDRLLRHGIHGIPPSSSWSRALGQSTLWLRRGRATRHVELLLTGATTQAQILVLVGVLLLLVGGLAWGYGRGGRSPTFLSLLSLATALTLLSYVWEHDGYGWASRLAFIAGPVFFPVIWALFFLSFPHDRLAQTRWRRSFALVLACACVTLVAYALCLTAGLPYDIAHLGGSGTFFSGLVLGLVALLHKGNGESARARQQRHIVTLSAAGAMLPTLLLAFLPDVMLGQPAIPYEATALALVILPLGLAYAIVRYDLMQIDVVVRRAIATAMSGLILTALTVGVTIPLHRWAPALSLAWVVTAVLAGAFVSPMVLGRSMLLVERLLSPELVRSRRLLAELDATVQQGEEMDVAAARLETAACAAVGVSWARLLVHCPGAGSNFSIPSGGSRTVSLETFTATLPAHPWGIARDDNRIPQAAEEWAALDETVATERATAVLLPITLHGTVIALLAVGERQGGDPLGGPDREALALLAGHFALAVDYARIRAELAAESADAAALSAASAQMTDALDDRAALPDRIVAALLGLRAVRGAALLLYEPDGTLAVTVRQGQDMPLDAPHDPAAALFATSPLPHAWLPLTVADTAIGALSLCWAAEHATGERDRRLLTVYANGAAMALEHARLYERARIEAERDPVTDLYNHRAFHTRLEAVLDRAAERHTPVSLLLIDVADFKLFNDTHGHQAGDRVLRHIGEVLRSCCRTSDSAARLGGDEFALLLPEADSASALAIAARIAELADSSGLTSPDGQRLPVRLTIGSATYPEDARAANALLTRADERMYAAKRAGVTVATVERGEESGQALGHFGLLEALVSMVDNRDRYTGEHSDQVATYACALATELGLSRDTIETLRLAGLLHDVGKIGVPDRLLRKPGRLTDQEFEIMRRHVELSEVLVTVISKERDLLDAVRYHHERWDGRGYPRGLSGADVPLLGRIMIVADAVSAMHMDRPYRKGLPWSVISQELIRGAGTQFDPELVTPALRALRAHLDHSDAA